MAPSKYAFQQYSSAAMQGTAMPRKPARPPTTKRAKNIIAVSGASRKLLIKRLREIDKLTTKELAILMADAEKIKAAFRLKR